MLDVFDSYSKQIDELFAWSNAQSRDRMQDWSNHAKVRESKGYHTRKPRAHSKTLGIILIHCNRTDIDKHNAYL